MDAGIGKVPRNRVPGHPELLAEVALKATISIAHLCVAESKIDEDMRSLEVVIYHQFPSRHRDWLRPFLWRHRFS